MLPHHNKQNQKPQIPFIIQNEDDPVHTAVCTAWHRQRGDTTRGAGHGCVGLHKAVVVNLEQSGKQNTNKCPENLENEKKPPENLLLPTPHCSQREVQ
jgi:hypothetical protein